MLILRCCRCNPRLPSTDRRSHYGPCWWSVVHNCNPSPNQLRKLDKSRLTDRTTVMVYVHGSIPPLPSLLHKLRLTNTDRHSIHDP
ncbi:hypothetical protein MTR67_044891 [Solanum verrucosum]|uniref:Uncharacterized protein n=1 Tax=Solanum verrucosum TaxID=315347 RepID=A0AAF0UUU5_SOLVR|nr:hypothetical protein MTR67_044891 [Solanum verrucosum]